MAAAAWTVAVLALAAVGYFAIFSNWAPAFVQGAMSRVGLAEPPPPPSCPLTGQPAPHGQVPDRPALAIKVENLPDARPQAGLDRADVVYEEPVEGGITRFIVVYQCHNAGRVGPVRSGRTTDPKVLVQFGRPVMGYAGAQAPVMRAIDRTGVLDVNYDIAVSAYTRDDSRPAPHNLYTSTRSLWKAAETTEGAPAPVFSSYSDVYWTWSRTQAAWLRSHGTVPHLLEDGTQVRAANVVVMQVQVTSGPIVDAAGNHSPEVELTGSGKAYVFRDGRMVIGRWERDTLKDVNTLVSKAGTQIALAPGVTWVELLPSTISVEAQR